MNSASAVVKLSRSKKRYSQQDKLLSAFVAMPSCTAKEVAVDGLGWQYENYCNAPKRAADLASKRLAYLEIVGNRDCAKTKADAHVYTITEKGLAYLARKHLLPVVAKPFESGGDESGGFIDCRAALDGL